MYFLFNKISKNKNKNFIFIFYFRIFKIQKNKKMISKAVFLGSLLRLVLISYAEF